ncbi:hypothetical protein Daus18300_010031 [Diaporthe australafricana]|uniref:AAA+ ATPase domain-containing protein n=1 Tax=Diaporthe australafricana TaxID=127596 RepID=A0ABR3WCH4_9PEZI
MAQCIEDKASQDSSSRYSLPAWFLERNVKTPSDLETLKDQVTVCQCKKCEAYKKNYEDIDTEDQPTVSEPPTEDPQPEEESHTSAEKHETSHEDAISYAKFSELRDLVAANMLWRHTRPQDSSVLLRRCSDTACHSCPMEPLLMDDVVVQVAKSLSLGLISFNAEDLKGLGGDFHAQEKRRSLSKNQQQVAETSVTEEIKETTTAKTTTASEGAAAEDSPDKNTPKGTQETSVESTASKTPEWKPDWADFTTFSDRYFAARSIKWDHDEEICSSAWRDRAKESFTTILDGVSVKAGQNRKHNDDNQTSTARDSASSPRGLLVHVIDCDHSHEALTYRQKRRMLVRLGELVQEKRRDGEDVVLVISSRTLAPWEKLCRKAGVSSTSSVTLSIVNPSLEARKERDLRRKGDINTRRLRRVLDASVHLPANAWPSIEWLQSGSNDQLTPYGHDIWPVDDIHRAAAQILARTWTKPQLVLSSKYIDSVLRKLGLLTKRKVAKKNDNEEVLDSGDSGDSGTVCDEVVDEVADEVSENPLDNLILNEHEENLRDCFVDSSDLKTTWDEVILNQDIKEVMQNLVPSSKLEVEASSEFLLSQLRIRGCLLYGPPGTGKTHLCRAVAGASGSRMLSVDYASIYGGAVGETEKMIRAAFSLARKLSPCVLFIDEVDSMFCRRKSGDSSWERSAITQFLVEMDGLSQSADSPLVVVATNMPWDLDEAFLRRLPQKFYIQLPDQDSRATILRLFLKLDDLDPAVDVDGLACVTNGFSGSDLKNLCAEAALIWKIEQVKLDSLYGTMSKTFATARKDPKRLRLDVDHFAAAFERMQPNKAKQSTAELERFSQQYNPVQGELGRGNGGKRYIFNEAGNKNEAFSVRELISRPVPLQDDTPVNMQLVVWRSADRVLFPAAACNQTSEHITSAPASDVPAQDWKIIGTCADETPKDSVSGLEEPTKQSVQKIHSTEIDILKAYPPSDPQDLCASTTPSTDCETIDERDAVGNDTESTVPSPTPQELSFLGPQKPKLGADPELMSLLISTFA